MSAMQGAEACSCTLARLAALTGGNPLVLSRPLARYLHTMSAVQGAEACSCTLARLAALTRGSFLLPRPLARMERPRCVRQHGSHWSRTGSDRETERVVLSRLLCRPTIPLGLHGHLQGPLHWQRRPH